MPIHNKQLSEEINRRARKEQSLRMQAIQNPQEKSLAKKVFECDMANLAFIKKTLTEHGWPGFDLVGRRASKNFWVLVQHIHDDIELQERALHLYEQALRDQQAHKHLFPYLYDRVHTAQGKKQKFGTQFNIRDGKLIPKPLQNSKRVDEYRKAYGLETMAEKIRKMEKTYRKMLKKSSRKQ